MLYDASDQTFYASGPDRTANRPLWRLDGTWLGNISGGSGGTNGVATFYNSDGLITTNRLVILGDALSWEGGGTTASKFLVGMTNGMGEFKVKASIIDLNSFGTTINGNVELRTPDYGSSKVGMVFTALVDGTGSGGWRYSSNLYTADGLLHSNRLVKLDGKKLTLDGENKAGSQFNILGNELSSNYALTNLSQGSLEYDFGSSLRLKMLAPTMGPAALGYVLTVVDASQRLVDFRPLSGSVANIYTTDGVLSENRTVNMTNKSLTFHSPVGLSGIFTVNADNWSLLGNNVGVIQAPTISADGNNIGIHASSDLTLQGDSNLYLKPPSMASALEGQVLTLQVSGNGTGAGRSLWQTASNIYNTDGMLLDNRSLNLNDKNLEINGPGTVHIGIASNNVSNVQIRGGGVNINAAGFPLAIEGTNVFMRGANILATSGRTHTHSAESMTVYTTNDLKLHSASTATLQADSELFIKPPSMASTTVGQVLTLETAGIGGGRAMWKDIAASTNGFTTGLATLTNGTVYRMFSPSPAFTGSSYADHFQVSARISVNSVGGESFAVGTSGPAKAIRLASGNLVPSGEMITNINYTLSFDAANDSWILMNPSSGMITDSTLYSSVSGSVITLGVATNSLGLNRITNIAASTLVGNPTGSAASPVPITLGAGLSYSGGSLVAQNLYTTDGTLTGNRTVDGGNNTLLWQNLFNNELRAQHIILAATNTLRLVSPAVRAGTATVGQVWTLAGATSGTGEWASVPGAPSTVSVTGNYTVAAGVGYVIADCTSGNITITLPAASAVQEVTIFRKDNSPNMIQILNNSGDSFNTGIGPFGVRLFLRGEFLKFKGMGSNLNLILESQSFDLGTLSDMRNYTMLFKDEFSWNTPAAMWGITGTATTPGVDPNHGYVMTVPTGAATNGWGYFALRNASVQLNTSNPLALTYDFMIPTLPTVSEYFVVEHGIGVAAAATGTDLSDSDCVMFRYASMENGGKFRVRVCAGGAANSLYTDDTVLTPAANTWYRVNLLMTSAQVYVVVSDPAGGTVIGPVTTGIPTAGTMTIMSRVMKGVGTSSRSITMDYFKSARVAAR